MKLQHALLAMLPAPKRRLADHAQLMNDLARFTAMTEDDFLVATQSCLKNVGRLTNTLGADAELRLVLIPELWDRLRPGVGDLLRRIHTTLDRYYGPSKNSFWRKTCFWSEASEAELVAEARTLRERITATRKASLPMLFEQVRFAIAGSQASDRFGIEDPVYEPALVYRLVPVLTQRVQAKFSSVTEPVLVSPLC